MKEKRLQVFVSSTFTDLIEERQAAVSAILKAGHIPAGMELFTAGDLSQLDTIRAWIDDSDVYMLILGGRYGSIEPISGLSYTELEYDYAIQSNKPFFAVVIEDDALEAKVKALGRQAIEQSNPTALSSFRAKVLSSISSFFKDPRDVKVCVFETLPELAAKPGLRGWIPGNAALENNALLDQISRLTKENEDLRAAISASEAKWEDSSEKQLKTWKNLSRWLSTMELKVPAEATGSEEWDTDVFTFLRGNKNLLVAGISNQSGASGATYYIYDKVCPALATHDILKNVAVPGARFRRYEMTDHGKEFFAYLDIVDAEYKLSKKVQEKNDTQNTGAVKPAFVGADPSPTTGAGGSVGKKESKPRTKKGQISAKARA